MSKIDSKVPFWTMLNFVGSDEKGNVLDPWQLSELLMAMGSMSVSVDDSSRGTDAEVPVLRDHFAPQVGAFGITIALPLSAVWWRVL